VSLEEESGSLLKALGWTLATAESATGGRIADRITNVPGSSDYFLGAVVAYHNSVKIALLGVSEPSLAQVGAVSEEVALQMARGVRKALGADVTVSTTGIAGPSGATPTKPVGLLYIAVATPKGASCRRFVFQGSRESNKESFTDAALAMLKEELQSCRVTL
jgi:PncC family amidohydrolase